jgi:hypothetical protein
LATEKGVPLKQVIIAAQAAYLQGGEKLELKPSPQPAAQSPEAEAPTEPLTPDGEGEKATGA